MLAPGIGVGWRSVGVAWRWCWQVSVTVGGTAERLGVRAVRSLTSHPHGHVASAPQQQQGMDGAVSARPPSGCVSRCVCCLGQGDLICRVGSKPMIVWHEARQGKARKGGMSKDAEVWAGIRLHPRGHGNQSRANEDPSHDKRDAIARAQQRWATGRKRPNGDHYWKPQTLVYKKVGIARTHWWEVGRSVVGSVD